MRVITGTARGLQLRELAGMETRPTASRVKEGMFNILQFDIEGRRVLDLFAGTGQLGIEALSRGAASAVFVDQRKDAVALVRENLRHTGLSEHAQVVCGDAASYLSSTRDTFDIIFLDPPYGDQLWKSALDAICRFDILRNHGILVCESPVNAEMPVLPPPFHCGKPHTYGKIKLTIYRREEGEV